MSTNAMTVDVEILDGMLSKKNYAEALDACESILAKDGDNIHVIERQAEAYKGGGDFCSAIGCLDRIIKLNPYSAATYFRKARWMIERGEYDLSIDLLKKVIDLDSVYFCEIANFILADIFWRKKKYTEAKEAVSHVSSGFEIRYMLGYKVRTAGDLRDDIESLRLCLQNKI